MIQIARGHFLPSLATFKQSTEVVSSELYSLIKSLQFLKLWLKL